MVKTFVVNYFRKNSTIEPRRCIAMIHFTTPQYAAFTALSEGGQRLCGLILAYQNNEHEFTLPQNWLWPQLGLDPQHQSGVEITQQLRTWSQELRPLFPHFTMRVGDNDIPSGDTVVTITY
jgi:hypothetical protein